MRLPRTCILNAQKPNSGRARNADTRGGFSLIELVVVIGIISLIAGIGLVMTMGEYRGYAFRSERDMFIASLFRARSQSLNAVCLGDTCAGGKSHGVAFLDSSIIIFQGVDYLHRDVSVDEEIPYVYLGGHLAPLPPVEVVFGVGSGGVPHDVSIEYRDDIRHSTISVNTSGAVSSSN